MSKQTEKTVTMKHFITAISIAALLTLCSACFNPFFTNPYFAVEESGLNWLEIYSKKMSEQKLSRIRIDGSGIVKIRSGSSPLVGDSYAKDPANESWQDIRNTQLTIPREEVVRIFQELVNNGLFVEQRASEDSPKDHLIRAFGNIDNHTVSAIIYDPELHEHLNSIVLLFDRPQQSKRR